MRLPDTAPIIVMGMHRSGTSLVARILSELGLHIGLVLDSHHESVCFKNINKCLLHDQGAHWARPAPFVSKLNDSAFVEQNAQKALHLLEQWFDSHGEPANGQLWGWKDPRNTLILPVWLEIFPNASVIHVVRNGIDVALSLYRREFRRYLHPSSEKRMFPPTIGAGYRLWTTYLEIGLQIEAQGSRCMRLRYEDLLSQPKEQLWALAHFLDIRVKPETIRTVAERLIKQPTRRSKKERIWVWFLLKTRIINPTPLVAMGYEPG